MPTVGLPLAQWGIFLVGHGDDRAVQFLGKLSAARLPHHLRGTGESFAANVGGRMIGTCAALVTTQLVPSMPGAGVPIKLAYAAAVVGTTAYVDRLRRQLLAAGTVADDLPD